MKLNRCGYLTVEIIIASAMAVTIAIFLMEITINLVNVSDDAYVSTEILTDKALIMKNIKENLEKDIEEFDGIYRVVPQTNGYKLSFCKEDAATEEDYVSTITIENNKLYYKNGLVSNGLTSVYDKSINKNLSSPSISSNITTTSNITDGYILFKIAADNKFSKDDFEVNVVVYNDRKCGS